MPTSPVDTRRNPDGTAGPPPAPVSTSPPSARSDPTRSVCPASFPHRSPSVFSPCAPAVEGNCPTTSDSRSCTGSLSGSLRNPQSTARRPLPLLDSLSLAYTLPRPPAWKYRTALPHSSAPPIAGWLIEFRLHNTTPWLHPISETSSLLRVVPPLVSASVLSPSWFFHLRLLRSHRSPRFPRSAQSPLTSSGHLNAGCRFGPKTGAAKARPAVTTPCGFDIVPTLSTRHQWFPCGPLLVSHLTWFFPGLSLLCSRPGLLTTAAEGGLEPAPASRFRGADPHRSNSYTHWALLGPLRSWRTVVGVAHQLGPRPLGWPIGSMKQLVEPMQIQVRQQRRGYPALWRPFLRPAPFTASALLLTPLYYRRLPPHPDPLQDRAVHHPHAHTRSEAESAESDRNSLSGPRHTPLDTRPANDRVSPPTLPRGDPCADRPGRNPYEPSRKSASKIGSRINRVAICTTRSRTVGIPNGLSFPFAFGM